MKVVDISGKRFWLLQVVRRLPIRHDLSSTEARWECICDCGRITEVAGSKLRTGKTKSCGCFSHNAIGDRNRTHGLSGGSSEAEYNAYRDMIRRCYDEACERYADWGGRGITVCKRWLESPVNFFTDMGAKPSRGHSLDRVDNNLGYYKENCRWAISEVQMNNTRRNTLVTYNGKTQTAARWARELGMHPGTVITRLVTRGWPPERAFSQPVQRRSNVSKVALQALPRLSPEL